MSELNEFEAKIWFIIINSCERHNNKGLKKEDFYANTKLLEIFPSEPKFLPNDEKAYYVDEQANRFGQMLFECYFKFREIFDLPDLKPNYNPREEFYKFLTLNDVFENFKNQIKEKK